MIKVKLHSGKELKITLAPFTEARKLYQVIAGELKGIKMSGSTEIDYSLGKDVICTLLESKRIEKALAKCMERCLYNGLKISDATFEPEEARGDYLMICTKVAEANIRPFVKSLSVEFSGIVEALKAKSPGLNSKKTTS